MEPPPSIDAHLPEGREPGPQSRRLDAGRRTSALLPAMAVLFIVCFIGIPLVVVSATGSNAVIYATIAALTVVFLVAMWLLARRFRSTAPSNFEVLAEPLEVWRGEEVEAELAIFDMDELADGLEVGVVCVERYDNPTGTPSEEGATTERTIDEAIAYERWLPAWRTEEPQTFSFRIPTDAPYSHEGDCLSFAWRVSARERGAGNEQGTSDDPIWVLP